MSNPQKTNSSDCSNSSPPTVLSMPELLETMKEISNMEIAHEITVNRDFQVQELVLSPDSVESKVQAILHKAFWDRLKDQLASVPPDYSQLICLLQDMKESLQSLLLPHQLHLQAEIEAALDIELIKQETEHGALDIPNLTTYILGTMATLCASTRDAEVQKLRGWSDPVDLLREIFRVLALMKMDMLNFTIKLLRPFFWEHSVRYERETFQEIMSKLPGRLALDRTAKWLSKAVAEVSTSATNGALGADATVVAKDISPNTSPTAVLNQAYMDLLHWEPGKEAYPETLLMDQGRLRFIQLQVNQLAIIAAVLLVSSNMCGSGVFSSSAHKDRLKHIAKALIKELPDKRLEDVLVDISNQIHQEVNEILLQQGCPALSNDKATSLKGQLRDIAGKNNAVRLIIEQRIQTFLKHCLSTDGQNCKNLPPALAPIQEELLEIGQRFGSLIHHNRRVFGPYYAEILQKLLPPEGNPEEGSASC